MRLSSLSLAVAVAFLGLSTAHAAQGPSVSAPEAAARIEQARALGFDQVEFSAQGRNSIMIKNAGVSRAVRAAALRARNVDEVGALLRGALAQTLNLSAGHDVQLDQFNELADGRKYYRMTQTYRGIPVIGDNITVQTDAAGTVEAVFGSGIAIGNLETGSRTNGIDTIKAATNAALQVDGVFLGSRSNIVFDVQPHLVVYALFGREPTLAWEATVRVDGANRPFASRIFADASSGALLNNITLITHAINRRVYDVANGCVNDTGSTITFPSGTTLKVSEGGSTAGQIQQVVAAYYQLGAVYWYFKNNFGRDSYDNAGGMMSGYVRTKFQSESCAGGNNAFWYNRMMVMGAGGTDFHDLSQSRDVTFHEIGHGVTEYTSNLIYQKEPGGLNEASSDIWGAAIEAWTNSFSGDPSASTPINYVPNAATWTIGEGLSVSNGDPLRWMNDPARDNYSADEYSDYTSRWGSCSPSSSNDQCGVHGSSGIANLAFYLMSQGGTHPRGATSVNVTAIGIAKAARYVYETHSSGSLSSSASFSQFRNAMQARARANANGGLCDEVRIAQAWSAVEVTGLAPQNANACGGGTNAAPVANFSASASGLTVTFTDSSTDSDGTIASRSWNFGDGTTSTATNPSKTYAAAGTYSVSLTVTDNAGSTNTKTGSVTVSSGGGGNVLTNGVAKTGLSVAQGASLSFTMTVPAGATNLKFVTSGGTGDADLYAKFNSAASSSSYDCKSEGSTTAETCTIATAQAGTYYVTVYGYSASSNFSLTGSYTAGGSGGTQTYSNTTDFAIGDNTTVDSPITVSGRTGNAPTNASVTVAIVHTYQGDLKVDLVAPDGTLYNIHNRTGGGTDNINKTVTLNLSSEALNGTWKLRVNDNGAGDTGRIDSWSITF